MARFKQGEQVMRARSLKPSLFTNELLAGADPLITVVFIGLWCAADREGRMEDRPAKLHICINPCRDMAGTVSAIDWLADHEFIERYEVDGKSYINVIKFLEHQRPHQNEKASVIPAPIKQHRPQVSTTKVASEYNQGSKRFALTPDSGLLTSDSSKNVLPSSPNPDNSGFLVREMSEPLKTVIQELKSKKALP